MSLSGGEFALLDDGYIIDPTFPKQAKLFARFNNFKKYCPGGELRGDEIECFAAFKKSSLEYIETTLALKLKINGNRIVQNSFEFIGASFGGTSGAAIEFKDTKGKQYVIKLFYPLMPNTTWRYNNTHDDGSSNFEDELKFNEQLLTKSPNLIKSYGYLWSLPLNIYNDRDIKKQHISPNLELDFTPTEFEEFKKKNIFATIMEKGEFSFIYLKDVLAASKRENKPVTELTEYNNYVACLLLHFGMGFSFLKDNEYVHLDIKPDNMMVNKFGDNNPLVIKLIDFGESKKTNMQEGDLKYINEAAHSPGMQAPETQTRPFKSSNKSDLYAAVYSLIIQMNGSDVVNSAEAIRKFITDHDINAGVKDLLTKCLDENYRTRYDSVDLINACLKYFKNKNILDKVIYYMEDVYRAQGEKLNSYLGDRLHADIRADVDRIFAAYESRLVAKLAREKRTAEELEMERRRVEAVAVRKANKKKRHKARKHETSIKKLTTLLEGQLRTILKKINKIYKVSYDNRPRTWTFSKVSMLNPDDNTLAINAIDELITSNSLQNVSHFMKQLDINIDTDVVETNAVIKHLKQWNVGALDKLDELYKLALRDISFKNRNMDSETFSGYINRIKSLTIKNPSNNIKLDLLEIVIPMAGGSIYKNKYLKYKAKYMVLKIINKNSIKNN
jgi:serine/threonine protein kinase